MNQSPRAWLARLSFSFFVVAVVLAWEAYQASAGRRPDAPPWRVPVFACAATVMFVLFLAGTKLRHARQDDHRPGDST